MIIKLKFGVAGAGAPVSAGSHSNAGSAGLSTKFTPPGGLNISMVNPSGDQPASHHINNVVDSGIRKTSEFFPEAA